MEEEKTYTVKEAAIVLGYHEMYLRDLIATGKIAAFKKGGRIFVYPSQITIWKNKQEKIEDIVPKVKEKTEE